MTKLLVPVRIGPGNTPPIGSEHSVLKAARATSFVSATSADWCGLLQNTWLPALARHAGNYVSVTVLPSLSEQDSVSRLEFF